MWLVSIIASHYQIVILLKQLATTGTSNETINSINYFDCKRFLLLILII